MKAIKTLLLSIIAMVTVAVPATAQFRFGPRIGTEVNRMSLNTDVFNNENRAGFTGGLQMEFTVPVVGVGFDVSLMYVHRINNNVYTGNTGSSSAADDEALINSSAYRNRDYIEIPVNFKYKIGLPLVGKIVTPYLFTGPSFAFLTSKKAITNAYKNKSVDVAWNFGVGLQLFSHLQVGASYGLGMTNSFKKISGIGGTDIEGKNKYWTITAAWMF